jgi:ComF family protein
MLGHAFKLAIASARRAHYIARSSLLRIALPNRCALCGNLSRHRVCGACDTSATENIGRRCPCCAATLESGEHLAPRCGTCLTTPPAFDATWVIADYAEPFDTLAQALKFSAQTGLASWFADKLAQHACVAGLEPDLIIPVPLSAQRLAFRGYNQSWEIARPLARHLHVATASTCLRRLRDTAPQTEMNDVRQRRHNVRGAFAIGPYQAQHLSGLHVAVVDDVMTSGATLAEIARVLKQAGVARVSNLVALRTPSPRTAPIQASPRYPSN